MDYDCLNCGEPWDVGLEPDVPREEVERWLEREYGPGFELSDDSGEWALRRCPCCQEPPDDQALRALVKEGYYD